MATVERRSDGAFLSLSDDHFPTTLARDPFQNPVGSLDRLAISGRLSTLPRVLRPLQGLARSIDSHEPDFHDTRSAGPVRRE